MGTVLWAAFLLFAWGCGAWMFTEAWRDDQLGWGIFWFILAVLNAHSFFTVVGWL